MLQECFSIIVGLAPKLNAISQEYIQRAALRFCDYCAATEYNRCPYARREETKLLALH
jgi:hypothetical protein